MTKFATIASVSALIAGLAAAPVLAAECGTVRISDVGWTDITATTAVASNVLTKIGYEPDVKVLSVAVTFKGLSQGDVDVFLGNWMPIQQAEIDEYVETGQVDHIRTNLTGAKLSLAVPTYLYDAGLKDFADIAKFSDQLDNTIHGIDPGTGANATVLAMIENNSLGLGDFELKESSEQGMLAALTRAEKRENAIVFMGWEPHPMNIRHDMKYITGGDDYFGPNFGGATVHTLSRAGYAQECPNVAKLFENMEFSLAMENGLMDQILNEGVEPDEAAAQWVADNPQVVAGWLAGVKTADGKDATSVLSGS